MKFSISTVPEIVLVALIAISQTYFLSSHSTVGDGVFYTNTFDFLKNSGLFEGYTIFQDNLGASEFFSYLIFYFFAQLVNYELFVHITNISLAFSIYFLYKRYEKGIIWYILTVPLNFYFLILCFGAQRLKLGILFLALVLVTSKKSRSRIYAGLALFSHFQIIIILFAEYVKGFFTGKARIPVMEILVAAAICVGIVMSVPMLQVKILSYVLERGDVSLYTFLFSFLIAVYISKFNIGVIAEFLFFFVLILIVGESRINILVFFVLWRLIFLEQKHPAFVSYPIALYLSVKGVVFMADVANGGTGFAVP
jgi:hypothetical protein